MSQQKKRAVLCPNCGKLISSSETVCPHCGISKPTSVWKNNILIRSASDEAKVIRLTIIVNAAMYILSLLLYPRAMGVSMNPLTMLSPSSQSLLLLGATGSYPIDQFGRWWSIISANFLHGSIIHILFNMLAFRQIAPLIIREFGVYRMLIIYLAGGTFGFLASYLAGVRITIGASAAVCSLIGAALFYGKNRGGVYGQAIFRQIGGWVIGIFLFGLLVPGINNWGHGGGLIGGALLGMIFGYNEKVRENITHKTIALTCAGAAGLTLTYAVVSSLLIRLLG
jgi:rhomboid protease GluP